MGNAIQLIAAHDAVIFSNPTFDWGHAFLASWLATSRKLMDLHRTGDCDKVNAAAALAKEQIFKQMHRWARKLDFCVDYLIFTKSFACTSKRRQETRFWLNASSPNLSTKMNSGNLKGKHHQILLKWSWSCAILESATIPRRLSKSKRDEVYWKAHTEVS